MRHRIIETLDATRPGHVGAALSLVEIIRVLYDDVLRYDVRNPKWGERDRCILSKGHGCLALYVVLQDKGFFPEEELWKFCESSGILGGHPEVKVPGVEASTGSLGHGLPIGIGFALNAKYEGADHRVFVIVGDGECNEGSVWEAALCAGKHKLSNLTVVIDHNKYQSYGLTRDVQNLEPFADKWKAFGFGVKEVDGHDVAALRAAFSAVPLEADKPTAIICHTLKGKGMNCTEGNMQWHHKSGIKDEEIRQLLAESEAY
ncbi:MAG: transketolase [Candidatus Omnitrophica bacterium]|nr:transketolase [Candidatus Omnitrophota bacterium]